MKNYLIAISLFFTVSSSALACGYGEPVYVDFYQLFIGSGEREECNCGTSGNIVEWNAFFNNKYQNKISEIVYAYSITEVEDLLKLEKKKTYKQALQYLIFAKELGASSKRIGGNIDPYSWEYEEILKNPEYNQELLDKGLKGFKKVKDKSIKMRYAYQIIRYLHYAKKYKEAISFYEKNVPQLNLKNELYYYCLDQVSGCYLSDGEVAKSAYGFLKVIESSKDRKESAMLSFSINSGWDFESLLKLCETKKEKVLARLLVSSEYYNYSDAEWIINNAFDEEALLSIYYYNDVHEEGKYYWLSPESYNKTNYYREGDKDSRKKEIDLIEQIIAHPETTKKDFWNMCLAYLQFLDGNFKEANNSVNRIEELTIVSENRFNYFKSFYVAVSEETVNDDVENKLYNVFEEFNTLGGNEHNLMLDLYYTMLKIYYLSNGENLKANLITLNKSDADQIYELEQLKDLRKIYEKTNKNKMEAYLLSKSLGSNLNIIHYVNEKTASYYLMTNDFNKAKEYFRKVPSGYEANISSQYLYDTVNYQFNGYSNIPKQIFSINIKEGFQFKMKKILTDETYKLAQFRFIKDKFNKAELNEYLMILKGMAKGGNVNANYLLGNYYYNNSQFGYFRNILIYYPENNFCFDCHTNELLSSNNEYSNTYYERALEMSNNNELKAKIIYLKSKNLAFPDFYGYDNEDQYMKISRIDSYHALFDELKTTYSNTKFYSEIIKECKTFEYYVSK